MEFKKVTLTIVCDADEANYVARQMEKSHIAQEGIYTLACGGIDDLTDDEKELILSEVPPELLEYSEED